MTWRRRWKGNWEGRWGDRGAEVWIDVSLDGLNVPRLSWYADEDGEGSVGASFGSTGCDPVVGVYVDVTAEHHPWLHAQLLRLVTWSWQRQYQRAQRKAWQAGRP